MKFEWQRNLQTRPQAMSSFLQRKVLSTGKENSNLWESFHMLLIEFKDFFGNKAFNTCELVDDSMKI